MIRRSVFVWLLCLFALGGCNKHESCISPALRASLGSLDIDHAKIEADTAFERHEWKFLAVYGYTTEILGVPDSDFALRHYPFQIIDGTTDAPCDEEHGALVNRARKYSAIYNAEIWRRLNPAK